MEWHSGISIVLQRVKSFSIILGRSRRPSIINWSEGRLSPPPDVRKIIEEIVFEEEKRLQEEKMEQERLALEQANRLCLNEYMDKYVEDIKSGDRSTYKGSNFSPNSAKTISCVANRIKESQEEKGRVLGFEDIDMGFYRDFMAFKKGRSYNINTTGKIINLFKTMLACAEEDGYPVNPAFRYKSFKGQRVLVDTIYLTRDDLKKMMAVDLSRMDPCYDKARDIFMIGVWTAQRVSDYNHLTRENLSEQIVRRTEKDGSVTERSIRTLTIVQQKTGKRVIIPCCKDLCEILDKYPNEFPFLWDQKLNQYIKVIGRMAGLTDPVEVTTTKCGRLEKSSQPKYELITTHTARRTGATLIYLAGMDVFDICKFTGHSDVQTLLRYIRADELETFKKVTEHYDYFD